MPAGPTDLDPFGYWPVQASGIAGLGGGEPPTTPRYAFHSSYARMQARRGRVALRFQGLRASRGTLRLRLNERRSDHRVRTVRTLSLPLADLARSGEEVVLRFGVRAKCCYALLGLITEDADAAADGLSLTLDPGAEDPTNRSALLAARRTVFDRGSQVGRSWWRRRSPVDRAGLISPEPATIAAPASQLCTERQLAEPAYAAWLAELGEQQKFHRKQWEVIYALAVLRERGLLRPGTRGIGFGCGTELLPSFLAGQGCAVLATDMPEDHGEAATWRDTGQFAGARDQLHLPHFVDREAFDRLVAYRAVDMNAVPADLRDFDFSWSLCAFEHLGSIRAGLDFIHAAVRCLRPGGIAVHTTEFNLLSDNDTVDNQSTVLFRRRDMEQLALELTRAGHRVLPLKYDPDDPWTHDHIDVPPYGDSHHLKLALGQYVTTSFGIAVVRGPDGG